MGWLTGSWRPNCVPCSDFVSFFSLLSLVSPCGCDELASKDHSKQKVSPLYEYVMSTPSSRSKMGISQRRNLMGFPLAILVWIAAIVNARGDFQQGCQDKHGVDKGLLARGVIGSNGKPSFKIALFADLHYGENAWEAWGPAQDANSSAVMSKLLDQELPDFVVFLGDVVTANNIPYHNATQHWQQAVAPTSDRQIPWAALFGNHDDAPFEWDPSWFGPSGVPILSGHGIQSSSQPPTQYYQGTTRAELLTADMSSSQSFSQAGPETLWPSVSNYVISIASSRGDATAAMLYFIDSGGGSMPEVISASQVAWFQSMASQNNPDTSIPEVVFWHIPSIAYSQVGPRASQHIQAPCVGSINYESVAAQSAEWGIMNILGNRPSVKAVVVGHNHGLDWCCPYQTLYLCFARHTGYGGYGTWTRGTRLLEIIREPNFQIKTWVTLEDGSVISEFIL